MWLEPVVITPCYGIKDWQQIGYGRGAWVRMQQNNDLYQAKIHLAVELNDIRACCD